MERDGHEQPDEGGEREILRERRHTFVDRDHAAEQFESQQVGDEERGHAQHHVAEHEKRCQQSVISPHHWAITSWNCCLKRSLPKVSAWRRMAAASNVRVAAARIASAKAATEPFCTRIPVTPSTRLSSAPPSASAMTGRPQACASTGTI